MTHGELKFEFTKMTGAGNDFVLIDDRNGQLQLDWSDTAKRVCHRKFGIGADGLLVIGASTRADFSMQYYNADGTYGGMCGNGGRCAALYMMKKKQLRQLRFETLDFVYSAAGENGQMIRLHMKDAANIRTNIALRIDDAAIVVHFIDSGAPHVVLFINDLPPALLDQVTTQGVVTLGRAIRSHPEFAPLGTNVNFVTEPEHGMISIRTYERGVEAETLACGTGSVASAVMASLLRNVAAPVQVKTISGDTLTVSFSSGEGGITNVVLRGPATEVFSGQIQLRPSEAPFAVGLIV